MARLSDCEWRLVERAYCDATDSVTDIAARFGIRPSTIYSRRDKFGWPPRRAGAITQTSPHNRETRIDEGDLIERFLALISLKLEQLENDMAGSTQCTSSDHERHARAIGTLVRGYEKISGVKRGGGHGGEDGGERPEAEVIRRELAEQIVRLRGTLSGDGG